MALCQTGEQVEKTSQQLFCMRSERLQTTFKAGHDFLDEAKGVNTNAFGKGMS